MRNFYAEDMYKTWGTVPEKAQAECVITGDKGYKLTDVENGKVSIEEELRRRMKEHWEGF